jgi:CRISPR type III-A-associated RAMP protein Csm4
MPPAVLVRLRPAGPWRYGPGDGGQNRTDTLFRSDRLFSAMTLASKQLGFLDEWLQATAGSSSPAVALSSLYPYQGDVLFVVPPSNLWPPPAVLVTSPSPLFLTKVRWNATRFVPVNLLEAILIGQKILADQWAPDPESACLLRRDRPSTPPFRTVLRTGAAVDRVSKESGAVHTFAGVEFESGAGLWGVVRYADEAASQTWNDRVKGIFRLLADTGLGGRRSAGWGQIQAAEFQDGAWPGVLFPKVARAAAKNGEDEKRSSLYWLLSLFSPNAADVVDWTGGDYNLVERGAADRKRVRLIAEGSVVKATAAPLGTAVDVADDGAPHPVYRSGIALALKLPAWPEQPEDLPLEAAAEPILEPEAAAEPMLELVEPEAPAETVPVPEPVEPEALLPAVEPTSEQTEVPVEESGTEEPGDAI